MQKDSFAQKPKGSDGTSPPKVLLTTEEVARTLVLCPHTVRRLVRKGVLPCLRFNARRIRFDSTAVEAYIASANVG